MAKYIKTEEGYKTIDSMGKMDATNPVGSGSFSMNRKVDTTIGDYSHAEGCYTEASSYYSHAEGCGTTASSIASHAEGYRTKASGECSHAEGNFTEASSDSSHAEGNRTKALGYYSHAEGSLTKASGECSHAEGVGTTASGKYQHVQGVYNINNVNANTYAHIVGNGTSDTARSNAHTVDWNGVGWFAGGLKVGGTGQDDESAVEVALKTDIPEMPVTSVNGMTGDVTIEIPEVPEQVQSDWDQNNSATLDYIKNRPFYTEDPTKVVIVEEETLTVGSDLYVECQFFPFEIGNTYFVTFNGTEYECVAWSDPNYEAGKTVCVGNGTFLGSDGYGDNLPFVIESYPVWGRATYLNVGETGDYILSVSETQSIVHQIDIKYVPHDDTKMDVENPVCTGTFSMNRKKDSPIGSYSFAEGGGVSASGIYSHAEGLATIATGNYSHAQGLYNIEDTENKYAHIVGNGGGHLGVYTRSNAHTLDWNGVGWFQGGLQVGGSAQDDGAKSVMLNGDKEIVLASSTEGSTKKFKLTIDDDGVLTATEIVESEA